MALTWNERRQVSSEKVYFMGACLSTDTKPTADYIANGSILLEMDTSTMYIYDAVGKVWRAWE